MNSGDFIVDFFKCTISPKPTRLFVVTAASAGGAWCSDFGGGLKTKVFKFNVSPDGTVTGSATYTKNAPPPPPPPPPPN